MAKNTQDLDARAFALFDQSLEQASDERRGWIIKQAGDDHGLRDRALEIFSNDQDGPDIILTGAAITESHVDDTSPERIGAYKIGEKLGQGGMGAVYRAERDKGDFDHSVAIKIIKPGLLSENLKARFQHEQQVLAQFSHANIARLFDGGTPGEAQYKGARTIGPVREHHCPAMTLAALWFQCQSWFAYCPLVKFLHGTRQLVECRTAYAEQVYLYRRKLRENLWMETHTNQTNTQPHP